MARAIDQDSFEAAEHQCFASRLHAGLRTLRRVLDSPGFGNGPATLGAELELCLVDDAARPLHLNHVIVDQHGDPRLCVEIDRFNVEYNLTPVAAAGRPFSAMEGELAEALRSVSRTAAASGGRLVPIGILPTLTAEDLGEAALTALPRYQALSRGLRASRHAPFAIRIDGADPLRMVTDDIAMEGANTSFQVHLRVEPGRFADTFNAAQLATPLALAIGANSPILLGHRLWDETRIALFKQSLDVRDVDDWRWRPPSRVAFGHGWVREGAWEQFAESAALFPSLMPICSDEEPAWEEGDPPPGLREVRLHQGTVWRWNRAIYDPGHGGHLRIEFRALPAGPTPIDMTASAAFLIGLTTGLRDGIHRLLPGMPFGAAEWNFYRAAQRGLDAYLLWPSDEAPGPREQPVTGLIARYLPVAAAGLQSLGVADADVGRMLSVIEGRLETGITGARWQRQAFERHLAHVPRPAALQAMVEEYIVHARDLQPVHAWS
jgi:gamma-glutamyl:cysteine ligase YbdK (ATP-grasp superfamily)